MTEKFLHFIWNMGLFQKNNLKAITGEAIEILKLGTLNHDAGPDFLNARVKINGTLWVGNIEIHIRASDWKKHNHHKDPNYDNVILHVVNEADRETTRINGELIPTIKLDYPEQYLRTFTELEISDRWVPCEEKIKSIDILIVSSWVETMLIDRLEQKTAFIESLLKDTSGDWEQSFFITFCKSLGQKVNGLPFEQLGRSVSVKQITRYQGQLMLLEAVLFGQAGMLDSQPQDDYQNYLKKEYNHLRNKHHLKPIDAQLWKFHRLRPLNFPTIRIAQLASFLVGKNSLLSTVVDKQSLSELRTFLATEATGYWKNHFQFGKPSQPKKKTFGKTAIDVIIINTIVPFLFTYGKLTGKNHLKEKALDFLNETAPEKNSITQGWQHLGFSINNAFDSQGFIQLKNKYCNARKCLSCRIGMKIITGDSN